MKTSLFFLIPIVIFGVWSCSGNKPEERKVSVVESVWEVEMPVNTYLSEFGFFEQPMAKLVPVAGVEPYELNSSLFTDYAFKKRFIFLPEGKKINYHATEVLDFPQGTVIIKNFYYPADFSKPDDDWTIIETRLLIHEPRGWTAYPYVWNAEQTDAKIHVEGKTQLVSWLDENGKTASVKYSVPSMPQCMSCHELSGKTMPIGPTVRQLNREGGHGKNQLTHLNELGWISNLPELNEIAKIIDYNDSQYALDKRARAYLEINCGHCHRPEGPAKNSALNLMAHVTNSAAFGVGKTPIAAGRGSGGLKYDIVPGKPDESIMIFRMNSTEPGIMMPELGRKMVHEEGVELIRAWIANME
jgi:uncharacterized repeat protein (TIGR03806 family)